MSRFDKLMNAAKAGKHAEESEVNDELERLDGQTSRHSNVQTPKHLDIQLSKSKDPNYQRTTVYLQKMVHRKLRSAALDEGKEMSEVIEDLVNQWLESRRDV